MNEPSDDERDRETPALRTDGGEDGGEGTGPAEDGGGDGPTGGADASGGDRSGDGSDPDGGETDSEEWEPVGEEGGGAGGSAGDEGDGGGADDEEYDAWEAVGEEGADEGPESEPESGSGSVPPDEPGPEGTSNGGTDAGGPPDEPGPEGATDEGTDAEEPPPDGTGGGSTPPPGPPPGDGAGEGDQGGTGPDAAPPPGPGGEDDPAGGSDRGDDRRAERDETGERDGRGPDDRERAAAEGAGEESERATTADGAEEDGIITRRRVLLVGGGLVGVVVLLAVAVAVGFAAGILGLPEVTGVSNDWGEANEDETIVETTVAVKNPNPVGIPGVVTVDYDVRMNDVVVGENTRKGVGLGPGTNRLVLSTPIRTEDVPEWWASHVENGERTTMVVDPTISAPLYSKDLAPTEREFSTNLLGTFNTSQSRTLSVGEDPIFEVRSVRADWGDPTTEETPITVEMRVHNPHSRPVDLSMLGYAIELNGVPVGNGTAGDAVIDPGETRTVTITGAIDNDRLAEWWPTHVENDEQSVLSVRPYLRDADQRHAVPGMKRRVQFRTAILSDGNTSTKSLATESRPIRRPTLESLNRSVTAVGSSTRVDTVATMKNPNPADSFLTQVVELDVSSTVTISGVRMVDVERTGMGLPSGRSKKTVSGTVSGQEVQRWWVGHVNAGERSDRRITTRVVADVLVTDYPVRERTRTRTIETDALSEFRSDEPRPITSNGTRTATVERRTATWGEATMNTTPLRARYTVTNEGNDSMTIRAVRYNITFGNTVLGAKTKSVDAVIPPGESSQQTTVAELDTDRIDDWWVGHVRRGQRSVLDVDLFLVIESGGERYRAQLKGFVSKTVETDLFGERKDSG